MNPSPEEALFALALAKPVEKRSAFLVALVAAHEQAQTVLATQAEATRPA